MVPDKVVERFIAGRTVAEPEACWPFSGGGFNKRGWHRTITWRGDGKKKTYLAHRVAFELAFGEIPEGLDVLHRCDNPPCCNPSHLFLGTQADNAKDMWRKGRGRSGAAKLVGRKKGPSPARKVDVDTAVSLYKQGWTQRKIAELFGCSDVAISNFIKNHPETQHLAGRGGASRTLRREALRVRAAAMRVGGETQKAVAKALGVSQAYISKLENTDG